MHKISDNRDQIQTTAKKGESMKKSYLYAISAIALSFFFSCIS